MIKNGKYRFGNNKVKAFTLLEIIIVLIISSTVITLAFWSYLNVSKYLKTYNENETLNQELVLFLSHFSNDISKAYTITEEKGYLHVNYYNSDPIEYDFYEDFIIRYFQNYPDTFKVSAVNYSYATEPLNDNWISEIHLTLQASGVEYPLVFNKYYTNQQLFQAYEY